MAAGVSSGLAPSTPPSPSPSRASFFFPLLSSARSLSSTLLFTPTTPPSSLSLSSLYLPPLSSSFLFLLSISFASHSSSPRVHRCFASGACNHVGRRKRRENHTKNKGEQVNGTQHNIGDRPPLIDCTLHHFSATPCTTKRCRVRLSNSNPSSNEPESVQGRALGRIQHTTQNQQKRRIVGVQKSGICSQDQAVPERSASVKPFVTRITARGSSVDFACAFCPPPSAASAWEASIIDILVDRAGSSHRHSAFCILQLVPGSTAEETPTSCPGP